MGRVVALMRAMTSTVAAAALVAGVPVVLVATVGNPFPDHVPTVDEVRLVLAQNGQSFGTVLISVLAIIVWFIWLQLVAALVVEAVAAARNRDARVLPALPGIQTLASKLIASMTLATTLATSPVLAPTIGALDLSPLDAPVITPSETQVEAMVAAPGLTGVDLSYPTESLPPPDGDDIVEPPGQGAQPTVELVLAEPTELWDLAEAVYGDGAQWKTIAVVSGSPGDVTVDVVDAGTTVVLRGTVDIAAAAAFGAVSEAGTGLQPHRTIAVEPVADVGAKAGDSTVHVVEAGESLWSIAEAEVTRHSDADGRGGADAHGDTDAYWREVVEANHDLPSGDADLIRPGDRVLLPSVEAERDGAEVHPAIDDDGEADPIEVFSWSDDEALAAEPPADLVVEAGAEPEILIDDDGEADPIEVSSWSGDEALAAESPADLVVEAGAEPEILIDDDGEADPIEVFSWTAADLEVPGADSGTDTDVAAGAERDADSADASSSATGPRTTEPAASSPEAGVPLPHVALASFGTALSIAGFVGAVQRRRRLQQRLRPEATRSQRPSSEAAAFEVALNHAAARVMSSDEGGGWRLLPARDLAGVHTAPAPSADMTGEGILRAVPLGRDEPLSRDEPLGRNEALRSGAEAQVNAAETLNAAPADLDEVVPTAPPLEFEPVDEINAAQDRVAADQPAEADAGDGEPPTTPEDQLAAAVVIGTTVESGDAVMIDLNEFDVVAMASMAGDQSLADDAIGGDPMSDIERLTRTVILDLAVSPRARDVCVIAVGVADELRDLERVRHVANWPLALVEAVRSGHAHDDADTRLVVVSPTAPADIDAITTLGSLGAVVIAPGVDAELTIQIGQQTAVLQPSGTVVTPAWLSPNDYDLAVELIETSAVEAVVPVQVDDERVNPAPSAGARVEPGLIEVQVLGPVAIAGAGEFSSLKATDVITCLAFHRQGLDADQLKTWVWPAYNPPTDKALANVLSRARTGLGVDADGSPWLSRAGADRLYRLDAAVTTDFERFETLARHSSEAERAGDEAAALEHVRRAVELIRGVPFGGGAASSFAWADNHVRANVEFTIDETVHRCVDLALRADDLATARWAALKGLEVLPGCEQCFRRRFLIARAANNRDELRRAMADLERSVDAELGEAEAVDYISAELIDLFHEVDRDLVRGGRR